MLFVEYPQCSTCQRAKKFLDERGEAYTYRHIKEENPSLEELRAWWRASGLPLKKFFNTSGLQYKALGLKDKLTSVAQLAFRFAVDFDDETVHRRLHALGTDELDFSHKEILLL